MSAAEVHVECLPLSDDFTEEPWRSSAFAIDSDRLEELVEAWSSHFAASEAPSVRQLLGHAPVRLPVSTGSEASIMDAPGQQDRMRAVEQWLSGFRTAAFAMDGNGLIVAANGAAMQLLGVTPDRPFSTLAIGEEGLKTMRRVAGELKAGRPARSQIFFERRFGTEEAALFHVQPIPGAAKGLAGVTTSLLSWPEQLTELISRTFGFTPAEAEVLKAMVLGASVKQIVAATGRTETTIRTHIRAILAKTGTHAQVEVVRMCLGFLEAVTPAAAPAAAPPPAPPPAPQRENLYHSFMLPESRQFDYLIIGDPRGSAFVLLPSDMGLTRLPKSAEDWLAQNGLRMIVPVRAGYGRSTPLAAHEDVLRNCASNTLDLLDHLGIGACPLLTLAGDIRFGIEMAMLAPARVPAIVALGPTMPLSSREQLHRMPKWTRFVFGTCRYAPQLLPVLGRTMFAYARKIGPRRFFQTVLESSPADLRALEDTEVLQALLQGCEISLSPVAPTHSAWARAARAIYGEDWSDRLRNCPAYLTVFAGTEDPFSPLSTLHEHLRARPRTELHEISEAGQLLHRHWPRFLAAIAHHMPRT